MRLFKYKSLANFEFAADILCNKRFYAAQFFELNDPMEGHFDHDPTTKRSYLNKIRDGKMDLRFCSFSSDIGNLLLWAHYADSFKGICIEVEVPDHLVCKVGYSEFTVYVSDEKDEVTELSRAILTCKNKAWKYEKEYRVFSNEKYISDLTIEAVYLGVRMPDTLKTAIRKLTPTEIPVHTTEINHNTNSVISSLRLRP